MILLKNIFPTLLLAVAISYDSQNCSTYGQLYTWNTATTVCPWGWHLPDTSEWKTLVKTIGGTNVAGALLKSKSATWGTNSNKDSLHFSALPGGYDENGVFMDLGAAGYWWTSSAIDLSHAFNVGMTTDSAVSQNANPISAAFSVRCIKD